MKTHRILILTLKALALFTSCSKDDDVATNEPLTITAINPAKAPAGTSINITGTGFNPTLVENNVTFNGKAATVKNASPTILTVEAPAGGTTGPVHVQVGSASAAGPVFTYEALLAITSIDPVAAPYGALVTIKGTAFSPIANENEVTFNGVAAIVKSATDTELKVQVPKRAGTGVVNVKVGTHIAAGPMFEYSFTGTVTSLAGGMLGRLDGTGLYAQFGYPYDIVMSANGQLYVADTFNKRIRGVSATGVVTTERWSMPTNQWGMPLRTFESPMSMAMDANNNLYVLASVKQTIVKVTDINVDATILAGGEEGYAEGTGAAAKFFNAKGIAVDVQGNVYVADAGNHRIRKITSAGVVTTLAGSTMGKTDGSGTQAKFYEPSGVAVDAQGNVYVTDMGNSLIRKITPAGVVSTLAGSADGAGYVNATGSDAQFTHPYDLVVDTKGNLFVVDDGNHCIRQITPSGVVSTVAGSAYGYEGLADGTGAEAKFRSPKGIARDKDGNLYVCDQANNSIRKIILE